MRVREVSREKLIVDIFKSQMQIQKVERERAEIDNDKNVLDNKTENNVQRVREKTQRLDSK